GMASSSASADAPSKADGPKGHQPASAPGAARAQAAAASFEEDQLQWALGESLREGGAAVAAGGAGPAEGAGAADAAQAAAAAEAARGIDAAERRRQDAEQRLVDARAREAATEVARGRIRVQLRENEELIQGLTERLDETQARVRAARRECEELEAALAARREGVGVGPASLLD
ncbi:unnamed protein product, partial [Prorocentrum cordatum]